MAFPITPLIDLSNSFLCLFCTWKLYRSYRLNPSNRVLKYFTSAYMLLIFAYLAFSLPRFFVPRDQLAIGVGFLVANAFIFLSTSYLVMVTTFFLSVSLHRIFFWVFLIFSTAVMIVGVANFQMPFYNTETGLTNWNIDPLFGTLTSVLLLSVLVPSGLFFFYQGIRTRHPVVRIRSILIGFGIAFLMVATATYYNATTHLLFYISDMFSLTAFLTIFIGVYYRRTSEETV